MIFYGLVPIGKYHHQIPQPFVGDDFWLTFSKHHGQANPSDWFWNGSDLVEKERRDPQVLAQGYGKWGNLPKLGPKNWQHCLKLVGEEKHDIFHFV